MKSSIVSSETAKTTGSPVRIDLKNHVHDKNSDIISPATLVEKHHYDSEVQTKKVSDVPN